MVRKLGTFAFLILILAGLFTLLLRLGGDAVALGRQMHQVSWLDGALTTLLDKKVARQLPGSAQLDGWLHGVLYAATGDAGPQVRQGCPGWLFLSEETTSTQNGERHLLQRLRLAGLLQADLKRRGIELVMVPVPDKVEQARSQLCGLAVSEQALGRRQAWQGASAKLAMKQVDLSEGWNAPGYWRTDSHWDRGGAALAAARVAASVLSIMPPGATVIRHEVSPERQVRSGDLVKLAKLEHNAPPFAPEAEYDHAMTLDIERGGSLLDDVGAPQVLLAGSSYSLNSGFFDVLQLKLGQEVTLQSRSGSGFAGSLLDVIEHPERLNGVKVVVWEWPLRVLYQPLTEEETLHLKQQGVPP